MMSQSFIEDIKTRLHKEKERLERDLQNLAIEDPKAPGKFHAAYDESGSDSEDDNSQEITNFVDEMSLVKRLESELRDTTNAIKAIENKSYGVCKYCGKEIDQKRLDARPTSSTCITCKKLLTQEL